MALSDERRAEGDERVRGTELGSLNCPTNESSLNGADSLTAEVRRAAACSRC
jgi:hypothetical protein